MGRKMIPVVMAMVLGGCATSTENDPDAYDDDGNAPPEQCTKPIDYTYCEAQVCAAEGAACEMGLGYAQLQAGTCTNGVCCGNTSTANSTLACDAPDAIYCEVGTCENIAGGSACSYGGGAEEGACWALSCCSWAPGY